MSSASKYLTSTPATLVGIDIGGTFTDFVVIHPEDGKVDSFKILSSPQNPAETVIQGLNRIRSSLSNHVSRITLHVIHGSTVATNALLERKGARTALITTRGFRDILQIGRQNRPSLYDLFADLPPPLIPRDLRLEIDERVDHQGNVLLSLDATHLESLISNLQSLNPTAVAVCLLFSFLRPEHEQIIARRLRQAGYFVSASSEVLPEFREYERMSTTAVNAYVSPILDRYLGRLSEEISIGTGEQGDQDEAIRIRVMQSNGGILSLDEARRSGVRCILSGPAGGITGAQYIARLALAQGASGSQTPLPKLITFDMGGTSTDVSLVDGSPRVTTEAVIGGCPIHIPILDIHTIGAGGGSIASVDLGGALRVGPDSAGSNPGPACYGLQDLELCRPTVTDANLVLGRLAPEHFLGGLMPLDASSAHFVLSHLGDELGLNPVQAALGVVEVVNAHMERALRVISVERGYDPGDFTLVTFGGAGGLHAADLARSLGVRRVLIPPLAATLSAFGMLAADVVNDYTQTVMLAGELSPHAINAALQPLIERGRADIQSQAFLPEQIHIECFLDMRYQGQAYEITIPWQAENGVLLEDFHALHRKTYGYARPQAPIEVVNVRVRAAGAVPPPAFPAQPDQGADPSPAFLEYRPVIGRDGAGVELPFYRGEDLHPGNILYGPVVVQRADTTIMLGPEDQGGVDGYNNLIIMIGGN
jgi:N-methylhydantoinase A